MRQLKLDFGPTEQDEQEVVYWNTLHQFSREVNRLGLWVVLDDLRTLDSWPKDFVGDIGSDC